MDVGEFDDLLDKSSSDDLTDSVDNVLIVYQNVKSTTDKTLDSNGSLEAGSHKKLVELENLTLVTPEKSAILMDLTLSINEKDHLLVRTYCKQYFLWCFIDHKIRPLFSMLMYTDSWA